VTGLSAKRGFRNDAKFIMRENHETMVSVLYLEAPREQSKIKLILKEIRRLINLM
jgi:hypothetical protein